jgi:hypothetical protein
MATSTIPLFGPDGTLHDVPMAQMKDALANGGKAAVRFQAPDKSIRYVPEDQTQAATKAGGQILPVEQQDKSFWSGSGADLWNSVKSLAAGIATAPGAAFNNPVGANMQIAQTIAANDLHRQDEGRSTPYRVVAGVGDALGIPARGMEDAADRGEQGGVLTTAAPSLALAAAPLVAKIPGVSKAVGAIADTANDARSFLAQKAVSPLVKTPLGMSMENAKFGRDPAAALSQEGMVGPNPAPGDTSLLGKGLIEKVGERVSELSKATDQTLQNHQNANAQIDTEPIIDQSIADAQAAARKVGNKAAVQRLSDLSDALKTEYGPVKGTPFEMNNLKRSIGEAGSELGAFKYSDPLEASAAGAMGDVYTGIKNAVNEQIPEVAPLNERVSNLLAAKTALTRNALLDANKSIFDSHTMYSAAAKAIKNTIASAPIRTGVARVLNTGNTLDVPEGASNAASQTTASPKGSAPTLEAQPANGRSGQSPAVHATSEPELPTASGASTELRVAGEDNAIPAKYEVRELKDVHPFEKNIADVANPERDTGVFNQVKTEHPDWSLSQQLMEAAKRTNPQ